MERATPVERLLFLDKSVAGLGRAEDADVYAFAVQAFDDPPDVMVGGPSLNEAKAVASLNPFFGDYAWGRSDLIEYKSDRGERLQGALLPCHRPPCEEGCRDARVRGEDHGLRRKPSQIDYQRRILQWFGRYLKNEPAQPWITDGVSHLDRERELKLLKAKKDS